MRTPERTRELGEVFTSQRDVQAILNLLEDVNYSSRYLEPGCGSGNFLVEILSRKCDLVKGLQEVKDDLKRGSTSELRLKLLIAVASVYGIDIDKLNVSESRERAFSEVEAFYLETTKEKTLPESFARALRFILANNIILGDLLETPSNITIWEYSELPGLKVNLRLFNYSDLLYPEDEVFDDTLRLFGHVPQATKDLGPVYFENLGE